MSLLLAVLYPIAIQFERGGWWRLVMPITLLALIVDIVANWTELSLVFGFPKQGEWTFSQRLKRLAWRSDWRGDLASACIAYCNKFDPQHDHIV